MQLKEVKTPPLIGGGQLGRTERQEVPRPVLRSHPLPPFTQWHWIQYKGCEVDCVHSAGVPVGVDAGVGVGVGLGLGVGVGVGPLQDAMG